MQNAKIITGEFSAGQTTEDDGIRKETEDILQEKA